VTLLHGDLMHWGYLRSIDDLRLPEGANITGVQIHLRSSHQRKGGVLAGSAISCSMSSYGSQTTRTITASKRPSVGPRSRAWRKPARIF